MFTTKKITILGAGVMGQIFIDSAAEVFKKSVLSVTDPNNQKLMAIKKQHRRILIFTDNLVAVKNSDVILLAVKPQSFADLAPELKGRINKDCLVISIMAGVPIVKIQSALGVKKVIRAMPNMGARVKKSATVWTGSKAVGVSEKKLARQWFGSIGLDLEVKKESLINSATAIAGSGPGFFFYLAQEWLRAASKMGFSREETHKLLFATIDAGNALLQKLGAPEVLKQQVTSKGGTTAAGLKIMERTIPAMWRATLSAAQKRARELSLSS